MERSRLGFAYFLFIAIMFVMSIPTLMVAMRRGAQTPEVPKFVLAPPGGVTVEGKIRQNTENFVSSELDGMCAWDWESLNVSLSEKGSIKDRILGLVREKRLDDYDQIKSILDYLEKAKTKDEIFARIEAIERGVAAVEPMPAAVEPVVLPPSLEEPEAVTAPVAPGVPPFELPEPGGRTVVDVMGHDPHSFVRDAVLSMVWDYNLSSEEEKTLHSSLSKLIWEKRLDDYDQVKSIFDYLKEAKTKDEIFARLEVVKQALEGS